MALLLLRSYPLRNAGSGQPAHDRTLVEFDDRPIEAVAMSHLRFFAFYMKEDEDGILNGRASIFQAAMLTMFTCTPSPTLLIFQPRLRRSYNSRQQIPLQAASPSIAPHLDWGLDRLSEEDAVSFVQAFPAAQYVCLHIKANAIFDDLIHASEAPMANPTSLIFYRTRQLAES